MSIAYSNVGKEYQKTKVIDVDDGIVDDTGLIASAQEHDTGGNRKQCCLR